MLSFKLLNKAFDTEKSNYLNSIIINSIFFTLVFPSIYFSDSSLACKYWFFINYNLLSHLLKTLSFNKKGF